MQGTKNEVLNLPGRRIRRLIEPVGQRSRWERCGFHPSGLARLGVSRDCRLGVRDHSSLASSRWVGSSCLQFRRKGPSSNSCGLLWANARHGTSGRGGPMLIGYAGPRSVSALEIAAPRWDKAWVLAAAQFRARHAATRHFVLRETASGRLRLSTSPALRRTSRGSGGPGRGAWSAPAWRGLLWGSPHPCKAQEAHAPAPPGRTVGDSMTED